MSKKLYIPLKLHSGIVTIANQKTQMILPPQCKGILFGFETKKAGKDFMGKERL